MRYAIISDIHGNLEALQAVFEACQQQNLERVLCLGDSVGYGANPKECLELLERVGAISVAGNHDWAVSGRLDASYFPDDGMEAVAWTRNQFSFEEIDLINRLKLTYSEENFMLVHSSPHQPEAFNYVTNIEKAKLAFESMNQPVCFIGHTHIPQICVKRDQDVIMTNILDLELVSEHQYIINVGSVGQPRDGNPMASYCIYDSDMQMIELKRVPYDIESTQKKIIEAGLPEKLAQRLLSGR